MIERRGFLKLLGMAPIAAVAGALGIKAATRSKPVWTRISGWDVGVVDDAGYVYCSTPEPGTTWLSEIVKGGEVEPSWIWMPFYEAP